MGYVPFPLRRLTPRQRTVLVLRYFSLVSRPVETLDTVARFLGIAEGLVGTVPPDNSRGFVKAGLRTEALSRLIRLGAVAGAYAPPQVWRRASVPLTRALQAGGPDRRPRLTPEQRSELLSGCTDDIAVLEDVLGRSFDDWRSVEGRGSFTERVAPTT